MTKTPITPEEFRSRMEGIDWGNSTEEAHMQADELMCELLRTLGYGEGVEIFRSMDNGYA